MTRKADMNQSDLTLAPWHLLLIVVAMFCIGIGLITPMATLDRLFLPADTYSLAAGVYNLFVDGEFLIGLLIFLFSIVFPVVKLAVLLLVYWRCRSGRSPGFRLGLLELLGKWSMLDVFVLAITFGAANLGVLSEVQIHWGIYFYGIGVLISILATFLVAWSLNEVDTAGVQPVRQQRTVSGRLLHALASLCFVAGIGLPLAEVEKWLFWERQYSLVSALPQLGAENELIMPVLLFVFVITLPMLHFVLTGIYRWQTRPSPALVNWANFLDKWGMFDVYVLAMLLVFVKLSDSAQVQLLAGFWALVAAAILNWLDRLWARRGERGSTSDAIDE